MWSEIIYKFDNLVIQNLHPGIKDLNKSFTEQIAVSLYKDIHQSTDPQSVNRIILNDFKKLPRAERSFWYDFAGQIPEKLKALNLFIRPFEDFCRTCIITDSEIDILARMDMERYNRGPSSDDTKKNVSFTGNSTPESQKTYHSLIRSSKNLSRELNYLIPVQLKKTGFEVLRHEEIVEIDMVMVKKLARANHAKYIREIRNKRGVVQSVTEDDGINYMTDFKALPVEIQYSNIDNSFHIPTKLLSIGYKLRPVKKGYKAVSLHLNEEEIETMAKVEHIRWSWEKRLNGWRYGDKRDNINKIHPSLVPYEELDEYEKEKDRELVRLIPSLLHDINYETYPIAPGRIKKISYALKPQSIIQRLLCETRNLSDEVRILALAYPEINEKVISINKKIEESIKEVQGSYDYARYIQEIFLPEDIYIRECFPESFVLFKPKNIVSGDFYFFRKRNDLIIFALADCTGHGIPGALISTIGYGNLDLVVNLKKISDPVMILHQLFSSVHRFMRRSIVGHGLQDDMDITMCQLDTKTNLLTYSGIGNIIYHITDGEINEVKSEHYKDDHNLENEYHFTSETIQMKIGDTLYLCSDGFADQLGGKNHKRYQRKKLMNFLYQIHESPMPVQNDLLYEEIEKWRGEKDEEQTDDISIIGIRI